MSGYILKLDRVEPPRYQQYLIEFRSTAELPAIGGGGKFDYIVAQILDAEP
ncbi:uncharacterized protein PHALS_07944 [Plasmopara halstedii]|uniref:Uncharacterized protein n=1 Tax=Plasmopara halstedii TaxID=4781 RepID=A0A0P1B6N8_PLAHL|nr:uncharacterized protein PHALS_07944 [Plasmopara halstedii]CEG50220.1 hypothetical protein PHALS_07944 [Plasmopara halstedii]|eukprot:XP_024586589.1 hypothetical protein PHALS_07944 [Plasmopara halstedii]